MKRPSVMTGTQTRKVLVKYTISVLLGCLLPACAAPNATAQITIRNTPTPLSGPVQASDGNFYASTWVDYASNQATSSTSCQPAGAPDPCGAIYRITPAGVTTKIFDFSTIPAYADGFIPNPLVIGPDGFLYGTTRGGGPNVCSSYTRQCGVFFKIGLDGTFTLLHAFVKAEFGTDYTAGGLSGRLIVGSDGNFYSASDNTGCLFKITPAGAVTLLYDFNTGNTGSVGVPNYTTGITPTGLTEGSDGNFYLPTIATSMTGGIITQVTPAGVAQAVAVFPFNKSLGYYPYGSLVQGPNGVFYGATQGDLLQYNVPSRSLGTIFSYTPGAGLKTLHQLASDDSEGIAIISGVLQATDGNFYASTQADGSGAPAVVQSNYGNGTFFSVSPAGKFTLIENFPGGTAGGAAAGEGQPLQSASGDILAPTEFSTLAGKSGEPAAGTLVDYAGGALPPITLTLTDPSTGLQVTQSQANIPLTLSWSAINAFSNTAQQCYAFVAGNDPNAGTWTGKQAGVLNANVFSGSASITPLHDGVFNYVLTCGGVESGYIQLTVIGPEITTTSLPQGSVGAQYTTTLAAIEGTPPYTWSVSATTPITGLAPGSSFIAAEPQPQAPAAPGLPPGLTLNAATGVISGTPTAPANLNVTLVAQDSAKPPLKGKATLALKVVKGLTITNTSLVKAHALANYKQQLMATGGVAPYTWSVTAGPLPEGLNLAPSTGLIAGKAKTPGTTKVTFQVADSAMPTAATQTVTLPLEIDPTVQIASVEFTQAIQQYQTLADLQSSITANGEPPVPMVTDKPAVMRVYFTSVSDATPVTLVVTGTGASTQTISLAPACDPTDARAHNSNCPSADIYFTPPTGPWTTTLTLNDAKGVQLEQETFAITSRDTYAIQFKGLTACVKGAITGCGNVQALLTATALTQQLWPTAKVSAQVQAVTVLNRFLAKPNDDTVGTYLELVLATTGKQYKPADGVADTTNKTRTAYATLYRGVLLQAGAIASLPGHAVVIPDIGDLTPVPDYMAHEFGHTINERHTNLGLPVRTTGAGCYAPAVDPATTWPYLSNNVQSSTGLEFGFNVATKTLIPPAAEYDIMGYCVPDWVSPINYKLAFALLNGGTVTSPSLVQSPAQPKTDATPRALTQGAFWQISGSIGSTGATLDPVFVEVLPGSTDPGTGTYQIKVAGSTGQTLFIRQFTPTIVEPDPFSTGLSYAPNPIFVEWIPVTAGATSIQILDPNGAVLASVAVTGSAPLVAFTTPSAGFQGSAQQTVSWTVQSTTASTFTSRLQYSNDGGATWSQIDETTDQTSVVDFTKLPGSASALLRVLASDGINTGSAVSIPFPVGRKLPSTVVINTPLPNAVQPAANPVYLSGAAYDVDDGVLTGKALQWSDSIQGALGSDSPLSVHLGAGTHTITLTGTDSDGNAISTTTQIVLGGAPPALSLTTTSTSGSCIDAVVNATPGASGAPLTGVSYSLDGGTTYTPIALTALPYLLRVPGQGNINLVATAIDASGQTSAQSVQLAITGTCTGSGSINVASGAGQSALEGTAFAIPLKVVALDAAGRPTPGVMVNFSVPTSGASATLSAATGVTGADGSLSVTATANLVSGTYNVTAAAPSLGASALIALTNLTAPTVTLLSINPVAPVAGQSLTFTASVKPAQGGGAPSGMVTFLDAGAPFGSATIMSGSAAFSQVLTAGSHTITASYSGDGMFSASLSTPVTVIVPAALVPTATSLAASPATAAAGTSVAFSARVQQSPGAGVPTGTLNFTEAGNVVSSQQLTNGTAVFTTSTLSVGTHTLTAMYAGDTVNAASVSSSATVTITAAPAQFAFTSSVSTLSVASPGTATAVLTVTSANGFNQPISFSCTGLPAHSTCSFAPSSVTPTAGASASTTLTVTTGVQQARQQGAPLSRRLPVAFAGLLFGVTLLRFRRRGTNLERRLLAILLAVAIAGLSGCGAAAPFSLTPSGTSSVLVTASGGGLSQTLTLVVTVQ